MHYIAACWLCRAMVIPAACCSSTNTSFYLAFATFSGEARAPHRSTPGENRNFSASLHHTLAVTFIYFCHVDGFVTPLALIFSLAF
jgi:hypothetical protein